MTLAEDIASALPVFRAQAESLMVDTCTVARPGVTTFNETTGREEPGASAAVYDGPCRVQLEALDVRNSDFGGGSANLSRVTVMLPMSAVGIGVQDVVTMTASALDPDLVGRVYRVEGVGAKTHATSRRLDCEEIRRPV